MQRSLIAGGSTSVVVALVCIGLGAVAQDAARPMFKTLPPHNYSPSAKPSQPGAQLPQWTFNWNSSYDNQNYSTVIVGTDPSKTNSATTVTVGIIPIKMVYGSGNGNMAFDPGAPYFGNYSTTQMIALSPIFRGEFDFDQGGTDLGKTQYIDAYQRGNFWGAVKSHKKYHILFATMTGPEQIFVVPAGEGTVIPNPWSGIPTGTADINWFDAQLQTLIGKFQQIQPNVLPLFITYNVYLTAGGGCCIGGYHSANAGPPGGQTYSYSTSISQASVPVFAQDTGALSHEIGEWLMDPFTTNASPCPGNGVLEVGDPLETGPNFGDYPYTIDGFTFHLQDLAFITWFGAPPATSLDVWNGVTEDVLTFQNEQLNVCQIAP